MLKALRRKKLMATPLPEEWRQMVAARDPFYRRLPEADRHELEGHMQVFLAEKQFEGCGEFVVNEEHKHLIASQACLLLLHRHTDYFPDLQTILIYPALYVVPTTRHVGGGVMEQRDESRAGESWYQGAVVLAWEEVRSGLETPERGYNLVLHEFAHQLDYEDGQADGAPLLGSGESASVRKQRYADWGRIMRSEYEQLRAQVQRGETTLLRGYGATNPAEFFAVATECFFCRARELQQKHPALYEQMKWYYQQDPSSWSGYA